VGWEKIRPKKARRNESKKWFLKTENIVLILILVLALYFRLKGIATRDLWIDEIYSVAQSQKSFLTIIKEVPTPIHYFFIHIFLYLGSGSFILGLPSVIFGLLTIYFAYLIAKRIFNTETGLMAAFLLAISPMLIEFSQQVLFFSYYTFFAVASFYFLVNFALSFEENKIKWWSLVLSIVFSLINIFTQMVAITIVPMEILFLVIFFIVKRKHLLKNIVPLLTIVALILIAGGLMMKIGAGGYKSFFTDHVNFDRNTPITLGWSLSHQVGNILVFNKKFYEAMFYWFSLGPGRKSLIYFILAIIGLFVAWITSRKKILVFLMTIWTTVPFVFLYYIRISHWFEEKYLIFIIPIYLIFVAYGIFLLTSLAAKLLFANGQQRKTSYYLQLLCALLILLGAARSIATRTSYGFPVFPDTMFSWRSAYTFLMDEFQEKDRIFVVKTGSKKEGDLFLQYYANNKLKTYEETYPLILNTEEYDKLAADEGKNYYVAVPDMQLLSSIADVVKADSRGGVKVYQFKFKPRVFPVVLGEKNGVVEYYDDFSTAKYLVDAYARNNLTSSVTELPQLPPTVGFKVLSPTKAEDANIDYNFSFPKNVQKIYIRPKFGLDSNFKFRVLVGSDKNKLKEIYSQESPGFQMYNPVIEFNPKNISLIRFEFDHIPDKSFAVGGAQLKSVFLTSQSKDKMYASAITPSSDGSSALNHNAQLELTRSFDWLKRSTGDGEGWLQNDVGQIMRYYGKAEEYPLDLKYQFEQPIKEFILKIKLFALPGNPITVSYSTDNKNWIMMKKYNNGEILDTLKSSQFESKSIYIRFQTDLQGDTSQIRDFNLTFQPR
jgi:4-amino-4-deoxy-L-arabinose transferase-like glycosyltransferase